MNETLTQNLLVFGGVLFVIGMVGFLTRRSLILMFLSLEIRKDQIHFESLMRLFAPPIPLAPKQQQT